MTVAALPRSIDYAEDGATVAFAVPWKFNAPEDVKALRTSAAGVETTLTYGTDYSVTGGATDAGGELTVTAAAAVGVTLSIWSETGRAQTDDYETNGTFPAETTEDEIDRLSMVDQEQDAELARRPSVRRGETGFQFPSVEDRASTLLAFDENGDPSVEFTAAEVRSAILNAAAALAAKYVADGVLFSAAGPGAVIRDVQDKLRDVVSVKDFGATGDGATDNTAAIQAAIDIGSDVHFPTGNYISGPLTVSADGQTFYGDGPQLSTVTFKAGETGDLFDSNGNRAYLRNLRIFGGDDTNKAFGGDTPSADRNALAMDMDQDGGVQSCVIHGFEGTGIRPRNSVSTRNSGFSVINCHIYHCHKGADLGEVLAEYIRFNGNGVVACYIGIRISSGNFTGTGNCLNDNGINVDLVTDNFGNNGHGCLSSSLINHGAVYNIRATDITANGFNFIGNCIIGGSGSGGSIIGMTNCTGILITGGSLGLEAIDVTGGGRNQVVGNYLIPGYDNLFNPSGGADTVFDNWDQDGGSPWCNRVPVVGLGRAQAGVHETVFRIGTSALRDTYGFEGTWLGNGSLLSLYAYNNNVRATNPTVVMDRDTNKITKLLCDFPAAADDAAAATAGVPVGGIYRASGALRQRLA